ncbi:putative UDP-galactose 4-epimerase [Hypoxylon sp. FL0543]|nr:putative UDP-galactose 4-epimerase [Hypoxylon sp. FL0543]
MKIAITGARGTVGREVVKLCSQEGHATVQINRTETEHDGTPNSEMRTADASSDYDATLKAFEGCDAVIHLAAIPDPVGKPDHVVHNNNTNSAFNGLRAAAELGIRRFCYASSVNAIGLAYASQPLKFPYFPIDEEAYPTDPTDAYALAKKEAEVAAKAFARWFPFMRIACLRIHEVAGRKPVHDEHIENWQDAGVKQLWGWVSPVATARACLLAVTSEDKNGFKEGTCEIFNIVAPDTAQETPSAELAKKYYPGTELRNVGQSWEKNRSFWTTEKAEKLLGWVHHEKE